MFCPKCGNQLSLFADKCLSCGMSFKNLSFAERQKLERKSRYQNPKRHSKPRRTSNKKQVKSNNPRKYNNKTTEVRIEYNNGYAVKEGMSKSGKKFNKGSFKRRNNNEGYGFSFPVNSLDH